MKKLLLFVMFCCIVGCTAVLSFCFFAGGNNIGDWLNTDHKNKGSEREAPVEEKRYGFQVIDGETYYYDDNGEKMTGVQKIDAHYYYFAEDGIMLKNAQRDCSFDGTLMPCYANNEGKLGFVATMPQQGVNPEEAAAASSATEGDKAFNINEVRHGVEEIMARHGGKTSVYFNDLTTNQKFCLNNMTMYPCCMIKTAALSTFMQQVENGEIDYHAYKPLIGPMIIDSDNTCYNRLMKGLGDGDALLGAQRLNAYCDTIGMTESAAHHGLKPGSDYFTSGNTSNVSSAQDIGHYFEKLYYGQLATTDHTKEMLDLYAQCDDLEGIAQGLPVGTVYAHKTGEAYACYHDGGIVYIKNRPYIVVAFTDGVPNNRAFLKELSQYLYQYQRAVA